MEFGSHARLKTVWVLYPCGFESHPGHHREKVNDLGLTEQNLSPLIIEYPKTSQKILPGLEIGSKFRAKIHYAGSLYVDEYELIPTLTHQDVIPSINSADEIEV